MSNYKQRTQASLKWVGLCLSLLATPLWAFDSNSTGADGALTPTADTVITVPLNGILNYSSINIPADVTVRFVNDATGPVTPVTILVQGDAIINGTIDISGNDGNAELGDLQAAGSYPGGAPQPSSRGGRGQGPGGGTGANIVVNQARGTRGASGSHRDSGLFNSINLTYGSESLQPLLGGSGGGSASTALITGGLGGSGGGAMLLAVSGTLTLNGSILANGGRGIPFEITTGVTSASGGGSGGAVRLVASLLDGNGTISVEGGREGILASSFNFSRGGGRIRLEGNVINFNGSVSPSGSTSILSTEPEPIVLANFPTVRISSIAGTPIPEAPTGINDITLPATLNNPVTVEFTATQVPIGSTIALRVSPVSAGQNPFRRFSGALTGSLESSTASIEVNLPTGASTLLASVNFVVTPSTAALYEPFADGEQVAQVKVESALGGGPSVMTLITESGRVIEVPAYANL